MLFVMLCLEGMHVTGLRWVLVLPSEECTLHLELANS